MSEHGRDWEKIWFIVMLLIVGIFVGVAYYTMISGTAATIRYGLPLESGVPKLPNGTIVIYMLSVEWAWIPQNATEIIYAPNGTVLHIPVRDFVTYVNGIPYIKVNPGQPVELILYSNDVGHGFYMNLPRGPQNWNIVPGINSYAFFYAPNTPGNYTFFCGEYCGIGHSYMYGYFWVM